MNFDGAFSKAQCFSDFSVGIEMGIGELLSAVIADDKASVQFLDGPRWGKRRELTVIVGDAIAVRVSLSPFWRARFPKLRR